MRKLALIEQAFKSLHRPLENPIELIPELSFEMFVPVVARYLPRERNEQDAPEKGVVVDVE